MTHEVKSVIEVAKDFSRFPGGRRRADGPYSGEEFREELLIPALKTFSEVSIVLDGVVGYPASFLEESFGGAVVELGYEIVKQKLKLRVSDDPFVTEEIEGYMKRAAGQ